MGKRTEEVKSLLEAARNEGQLVGADLDRLESLAELEARVWSTRLPGGWVLVWCGPRYWTEHGCPEDAENPGGWGFGAARVEEASNDLDADLDLDWSEVDELFQTAPDAVEAVHEFEEGDR